MTQTSMFWPGVTLGDCGPYSADEFAEFMRALFCLNPATQGPLKGSLTYALSCSFPTNPPDNLRVIMSPGKALVYGTLYVNTVSITFTPVSAAHIHYYKIILRKSWAANTVRAVLLGPSDISLADLTMTQTIGVTWEIPIYGIVVAAGATGSVGLTLSDLRVMCVFASE